MKKYKLTGCARFLIFLVIFAPIAFFGASYLTGGDPIASLKEMWNTPPDEYNRRQNSPSSKDVQKPSDYQLNESDMQKLIDTQRDEIKKLRAENAELKRKLQSQ